ncbi:ABC-type uncharacterized transport system, permease component [Desulfonauticus submarinus]|uniref:ABC-type uncharacterized transport system, permease component n=1 Tax=Desulfonauticus submarinus TaxID=206665 RepID=A0A1H0F6X2_9BACT|nr:cytochrome c biogenesis protein CcsA [Desulfonauticus submarinus]SDN90410.1 ABC-type uncharacterized transport system, permease component [Desulfonauticus submarinus]
MNLKIELIIAVFYFLACLEIFTGYLKQNPKLKKIGSITLGVGFILHSLALLNISIAQTKLNILNGPFYFNLLSWIILVVIFILWIKIKLEFLFLIGGPLALLFYISSILTTFKIKNLIASQTISLWFGLHILTLFLSLAFLALAFGSGLVYLYLEKKIKTKSKLPNFSKDMPSLTTFDKLNHLATICGFPLFSLGLFTGFIWASLAWQKIFTWDPKEVLALIIWIFFAYLFHQRLALGWKGRRPAKLAIFIFILFLISLIGINFLMPTHHAFK